MATSDIEPGSFEHRFGGMYRLYGKDVADGLRSKTVSIIGVGGVGQAPNRLPRGQSDFLDFVALLSVFLAGAEESEALAEPSPLDSTLSLLGLALSLSALAAFL